MRNTIQNLFNDQLDTWMLAKNNYAALEQVRVKELVVNGIGYKVQFNPARIVSSAAKVDSKSIQERKCFLCPAHLPAEQKGIPFGERYTLLVNPFPIFPRHLTITEKAHVDQRILMRIGDMLDLAATLPDFVIFYNGPKCGASAPVHAHFQAGNKGFLPIEQQWKTRREKRIVTQGEATLWLLNDAPRHTLVIESKHKEEAVELFHRIYNALDQQADQEEPMMNVLAWFETNGEQNQDSGTYVVCVFPRSLHRPSCYTAEGEANMLISPASVDMGGVFIMPREADFEKITATDIANILTEVCLSAEALESLIERIKQ